MKLSWLARARFEPSPLAGAAGVNRILLATAGVAASFFMSTGLAEAKLVKANKRPAEAALLTNMMKWFFVLHNRMLYFEKTRDSATRS